MTIPDGLITLGNTLLASWGFWLLDRGVLDLPFPDASFDVVLCTEVIEHTTDPRRAVSELCRVLRPAGDLMLTVPNRAWHWAVRAANSLRVRPYRGYENWVGYGELASWARGQGLAVRRQFGFNLLPHTFFCRSSFDRLDAIAALHPYMINIALKASKYSDARCA